MSITAMVENGLIKLPPGFDVPDGTNVEIRLPEPAMATVAPDGSLSWMLAWAGAIEGPEDMAAEHDHYLHGTPKRGSQ